MELKLIDHIVIIVRDLQKTEQFYSSFLGKPAHFDRQYAVYQIGYTRLFFSSPKNGEFEERDKDKGSLNHLAFGVNTIEELKAFEKILNDASIKNSGIKIDSYGNTEYIWFDDPSGFRLEIYYRPLK